MRTGLRSDSRYLQHSESKAGAIITGLERCTLVTHWRKQKGPIHSCWERESDRVITRKIKESGTLMDIQLLDHLIIIPEGKYFSMDEGLILNITVYHPQRILIYYLLILLSFLHVFENSLYYQ